MNLREDGPRLSSGLNHGCRHFHTETMATCSAKRTATGNCTSYPRGTIVSSSLHDILTGSGQAVRCHGTTCRVTSTQHRILHQRSTPCITASHTTTQHTEHK